MLQLGIIRPSSSSWSLPLHMEPKSSGDWRPCGDYRALNRSMTPACYPVSPTSTTSLLLFTSWCYRFLEAGPASCLSSDSRCPL